MKQPQPDRVSGYINQFRALLKDPTNPFTLIARFSVKDGTQAKLEEAFARARVATQSESGVIAYDLNREATDSTRYVVYERWKSLTDLELHLRTSYITKLMAEVDEVLAAAPEFNTLEPAAQLGTPNEEGTDITQEAGTKGDFRLPTASKWSAPRAVADGAGGTIIATAEIAAPPERVFTALTTSEVEEWWGHKDFYRQTDWKADLRVCGQWNVTVRFLDGSTNGGSGEFAEVDPPHKLAMTRKFEKHPLQGERETTITYRFEPVANGTRVTMREEGYIGRSEAAYGNAEHWERVLAWLDTYIRRATLGTILDKRHSSEKLGKADGTEAA